MLMERVTPKMIKEWKLIFEQYRNRLKPNRKKGQEIVDYLMEKYSLSSVTNERAKEVVSLNVLENEHLKEKLPEGEKPNPVAFYLDDNRNEVFIGVDLVSGFYLVEGSRELYDELCAFQGLDAKDLENYFCVARYIICLKKFNRLDSVLEQ